MNLRKKEETGFLNHEFIAFVTDRTLTQKLKTQTSFSFELLQAFLKKERNKLYGKKLSQFLQRTRSQLSSDYKNGSFVPPTAFYIVALHSVSSYNFFQKIYLLKFMFGLPSFYFEKSHKIFWVRKNKGFHRYMIFNVI